MTSYQKNSSDLLHKIGLIFVAFVLFDAAFFFYVRSEKAIDIANEERLISHELGDELRLSSDNLTHMVRSYVITGNQKYKQQYQNILDIRNGKKPRPLDYHDTYESQAITNTNDPKLSGKAVPLVNLIEQSGISHAEMQLMHAALAQSNLLSVTEYEAMRLIESRPLSKENREKAIRILFDTNYDKAKSAIMHSIYEYNRLMEKSTAQSVREAEQFAFTLRIIFIFSGLILFIALWHAYKDQLVVYQELSQYKEAVENTFIVSKADKGGIITYVNDIFCAISGYSRDELLGKAHNIIRHPDMSKETFKELWGDISHKKIWRGTIKNLNKDGNSYFVKSTIIPMLNEKGQIVEYLGLREDVSEIENARLKAEKAEQIITNFMANMSHEIRTPINGIAGFADLLSQTSLDTKQKRYLSVINNSINALVHIVDNILDFSNIESGEIKLELVNINLHNELDDFAKLFLPLADEKKLDYTFKLDDNLHKCLKVDIQHLKHILEKIVGNAIKFTDHGGKVHFSVDMLGDTATQQVIKFSIADTGIGIKKENLRSIFDTFSQADLSDTRKFGGTGLGLSIANALVKLMGGVLHVESKENEGSLFSFQITVEKCHSGVFDPDHSDSNPTLANPYDDAVAYAAELLNLDKTITKRLFDKFLISVYEDIEKLNLAINNKMYEEIDQYAQKIEGASGTIGLTTIQRQMKEIKDQALNKNADYDYANTVAMVSTNIETLKESMKNS